MGVDTWAWWAPYAFAGASATLGIVGVVSLTLVCNVREELLGAALRGRADVSKRRFLAWGLPASSATLSASLALAALAWVAATRPPGLGPEASPVSGPDAFSSRSPRALAIGKALEGSHVFVAADAIGSSDELDAFLASSSGDLAAIFTLPEGTMSSREEMDAARATLDRRLAARSRRLASTTVETVRREDLAGGVSPEMAWRKGVLLHGM